MHVVSEASLRIPEDIAVVGCGNVGYSEYLRHPHTSIDQSIPEQGRVAAGALTLGLDSQAVQLPYRPAQAAPIIRESTVRSESIRATTAPARDS